MLKKVKAYIDKYNMLKTGDRVLAACSGGPDSLALVHILHGLCLEYNIKLFVAHVDHMLRGEESAQDAQFVVQFCRDKGIKCFQTAIDVPQFIEQSGLSTEEAARLLRYRYLKNVASKLGGAVIATGHHKDDQAETVLIHILRGSGSVGISGIKPVNNNIIRPLLAVSRTEINKYCELNNLKPRFDSTNLNTDYLRNKIRIKLIPELKRVYNNSINEALFRTAIIVGDEHDFINTEAKRLLPQVVHQEELSLFIDSNKVQQLHTALQREIIRLAIEKKHGSLTGITFYHVERLIELLLNGRVGSILEFPGGLIAHKGYTGLYLQEKSSIIQLEKLEKFSRELSIPGRTELPEIKKVIIAELLDKPDEYGENTAVFDFDKITKPIIVRTRLEGDRFQPVGLKGSKKLKEFLIDAKVPRKQRNTIPICCDSQGIIWVGGYRQDQRAIVSATTKSILKLTIVGGNNCD